MTLSEFEIELRSLVGNDPSLRPFVCEGSPLNCGALVGTNPATKLPFWPYWESKYGFRKRDWLQAYDATRIEQGKRTKRSPTRNALERIVAAAAPVNCLETNIFSTPSPRAKDLREGDRQTRVFEFLLEAIRSFVMHVHGEKAREYLRKAYGVQLTVGQIGTMRTAWGAVLVWPTNHLAYRNQWSNERPKEMGEWLASKGVRTQVPPA